MASSTADGDLKKTVKALGDAIGKMSGELDPEKQQEAAQDFDTIATEAAKEKPRKRVLTAALDGLKATAAFALKNGAQVVALIGTIHEMIKHR